MVGHRFLVPLFLLVTLAVSYQGFWTLVLIAPVPGHSLALTFEPDLILCKTFAIKTKGLCIPQSHTCIFNLG